MAEQPISEEPVVEEQDEAAAEPVADEAEPAPKDPSDS